MSNRAKTQYRNEFGLFDMPDKTPFWMTCPVDQFMRYLRMVEAQRCIVWPRADAYSAERGRGVVTGVNAVV